MFALYWRCWCRFYEEKQFVVNIGTWTMNQNALWQLKSPQTKNRKTKTACCKMVAMKKVGQKNGEVGLLVEYLFCVSVNRGSPTIYPWFLSKIKPKLVILHRPWMFSLLKTHTVDILHHVTNGKCPLFSCEAKSYLLSLTRSAIL